MAKIRVGGGQDEGIEMGPLITREHRDKVASVSYTHLTLPTSDLV